MQNDLHGLQWETTNEPKGPDDYKEGRCHRLPHMFEVEDCFRHKSDGANFDVIRTGIYLILLHCICFSI